MEFAKKKLRQLNSSWALALLVAAMVSVTGCGAAENIIDEVQAANDNGAQVTDVQDPVIEPGNGGGNGGGGGGGGGFGPGRFDPAVLDNAELVDSNPDTPDDENTGGGGLGETPDKCNNINGSKFLINSDNVTGENVGEVADPKNCVII